MTGPPGGSTPIGRAAELISQKLGMPPSRARGKDAADDPPCYPLMWARPSDDDFERDHGLDIQGLLTADHVPEVSLAASEGAWADTEAGDVLSRYTVKRYVDVDSIYMEATSLSALQVNVELCFLPPFTSTTTQNSHRRLRGNVQPHKCKNLRLLKAGPMTMEVVFPGLEINPDAGQTNALSDKQLRQFVDGHLLPCLREVVPAVILEQMPQSFDAAVASASTSQVKMQGANGTNPNRQRTMLTYAVKDQHLGPLWDRLQASLNNSDQFGGARLLLQGHDLKNKTVGDTPAEMLSELRRHVFLHVRFPHILWERCWVDFGMRDVVECPPGAQTRGYTVLYRPCCLRHMHTTGADNPWVGFSSRDYTQYLLRDASSLELIRDGPGAAPPGAAMFVRQLKAYNSHKMVFFTPDKQHHAFQQEAFGRLVLSDDVLAELTEALTGNRSRRGGEPGAAHSAWEKQQRHIHDQLTAKHRPDYGGRREVVINLFVLLRMFAERTLEEGAYLSHNRYLFTGPAGGGDVVRPPEGAHVPFHVVRTADLNDLIKANVSRYVVAINRLIARVRPAGQGQQQPTAPVPTGLQLSLARFNLVLIRLLSYSCSSVVPSREALIFRDRWVARDRDANGEKPVRYGLGLESVLSRRGMVHLAEGQVDFTLPSLTPEVDRALHWPAAYAVRAPGNDEVNTRTEIVAFNSFVAHHTRDLYDEARAQMLAGAGSAAHKTIAKIFLLEIEGIAASYNRFLLRTLAKQIARSFSLKLTAVTEQVLRPLGLEPTHRASSRILSLSDIDRIFVQTYKVVGNAKLKQMFGHEGASVHDLDLPLPLVSETRKKEVVTWSGFVAWCIRGMRSSVVQRASGWRDTDFTRRFWSARDRWAGFAQLYLPGLEHLWDLFADTYAGRFILVTPNFDNSKFMSPQSSLRLDAHKPKVFYVKWCIPAVDESALSSADDMVDIQRLMMRARLYHLMSMPGGVPTWLQRHAEEKINTRLGHENQGPVYLPRATLRQSFHSRQCERPRAFRAAAQALRFRTDNTGHVSDGAVYYKLNSGVTPPADAYVIDNLVPRRQGAPSRAERCTEQLRVFGNKAAVAFPCMWVFSPFHLEHSPDHLALQELLRLVGWFQCRRDTASNGQHFPFFRQLHDNAFGLDPALTYLPMLLDQHIETHNVLVEAAIDAQDDELFPGIEDL